MAANTAKTRVFALSFCKRFFNPSSLSATRTPIRRAAHTSVYDKNPEDHTPNVVPDHVIPPQPETYWAPHPQTGVFGPSAEQTLTAAGERDFHPTAVKGGSGEGSMLEEKAWFRHTDVEDLEKPHAL